MERSDRGSLLDGLKPLKEEKRPFSRKAIDECFLTVND